MPAKRFVMPARLEQAHGCAPSVAGTGGVGVAAAGAGVVGIVTAGTALQELLHALQRLSLLVLDDALGVPGVGDRAEPEQDELRTPARRRAVFRISGQNANARPALIAPSTVREPIVTTSTTTRGRGRAGSWRCSSPAASWIESRPPPSPAMPADSANATICERTGLMPIDCGRDLAPAQRVEVVAGRAPSHDDHDDTDDGEQQQREQEERLVVREVERADHRCAARGRGLPAARPFRGAITLSNMNANASVASAR